MVWDVGKGVLPGNYEKHWERLDGAKVRLPLSDEFLKGDFCCIGWCHATVLMGLYTINIYPSLVVYDNNKHRVNEKPKTHPCYYIFDNLLHA